MLTVQILDGFWGKWEADPKIHVDPRDPAAKAILKQNKVEGPTCPDCETYHEVTLAKTEWCTRT